MTCHVAWSDPHGEHTCRHNAGHETRRHGCVCGSYANGRDSVVHDSHSEAAQGRDGRGDSRREVLDPPVHLPVGH